MPLKGILYILIVFIGLFMTFRTPIAGLLLYSLMTFIRPEALGYGSLAPFKLYTVVFGVLLLSIIVNKQFSADLFKNNSPILIALALLLLFQFLSSFNALSFDLSFHYNKELAKTLLFCFLMAGLIRDKKSFGQLRIVYLLGSGFLAIWGFKEHFRGNFRLEEIGGGATNTSNGIAVLFLIYLPLFVHEISNKNNLVKLGCLFMSGIFLADIVFTQSRSAFVGLLVMGAYLFLRHKSKRKYIALLIAPFIFYYAATSTSIGEESYLDRLKNMQEKGMEVDQSASARKHLWRAAWAMFKDNILIGVGQQNYQFSAFNYLSGERLEWYEAINKPTVDAHNTFLLVLVEGGIFAFLIFCFCIFYHFYELWKIEKRYKNKDINVYHMALFFEGSMIGYIISGLAHSYVTMVYFYWLLTMPVIMKNIYMSEPPKNTGVLSREIS